MNPRDIAGECRRDFCTNSGTVSKVTLEHFVMGSAERHVNVYLYKNTILSWNLKQVFSLVWEHPEIRVNEAKSRYCVGPFLFLFVCVLVCFFLIKLLFFFNPLVSCSIFQADNWFRIYTAKETYKCNEILYYFFYEQFLSLSVNMMLFCYSSQLKTWTNMNSNARIEEFVCTVVCWTAPPRNTQDLCNFRSAPLTVVCSRWQQYIFITYRYTQ